MTGTIFNVMMKAVAFPKVRFRITLNLDYELWLVCEMDFSASESSIHLFIHTFIERMNVLADLMELIYEVLSLVS